MLSSQAITFVGEPHVKNEPKTKFVELRGRRRSHFKITQKLKVAKVTLTNREAMSLRLR